MFNEEVQRISGDILVSQKATSSNYIVVDNVNQIDFGRSNVYKLILKENSTFPIPIEIIPGITYTIIVQQDTIGGRTLTFPSTYTFPKGDTDKLISTANGVTIITLKSIDSITIYGELLSSLVTGGMTTQQVADLTKATPLVNQVYAGEFNISTNYEVYYNQYPTNVAETPTISATPIIGACARVVFDAGAAASLVATNLGLKRPGSDDFTVSKLNEISVFNFPEGLEYNIKVLN